VPDLAIVTLPTLDGSVGAPTLVAARLAGVETVYKCGGAQAVAAVAYGTETVKPALKTVGLRDSAWELHTLQHRESWPRPQRGPSDEPLSPHLWTAVRRGLRQAVLDRLHHRWRLSRIRQACPHARDL
jgi:hypothetical protein